MTHDHLSDRELLLLVLEKQEIQMAQTEALTAAVSELTTVVGEVVAVVNGTDDQAAIDAATTAIETAITDLKGALPKPVPVVSSLTPNTGGEGTSVVIDGSGLTGATSVDFGPTGSTFTVDSDSQITATAPAGEGAVSVVVATPGGSSAPVEYTF